MAKRTSRVTKLFRKQRVKTRRGGWAIPSGVKGFIALTAKIFCVLVFLSAAGFLGYAVYEFSQSKYFEIKALVIRGVSDDIAAELRVMTQLEANRGINLLRVRSRRVCETILRHPKIRSVRVTKHFPNVLIIDVEKRVPVAVVSSGALYLVDREGYVLEHVANLKPTQQHFPFITGIDAKSIALGEPIPTKSISQALDLFECLSRKNMGLASKVSEIRVHPEEGLTLVLKKGVEVRLGQGQFAERLAALEMLMKRRRSIEDLKYIDLRFQNQLVYRVRDI